jgi:hypothetical protein
MVETEALIKHRKAELSEIEAGFDPEMLAARRFKVALRQDPAIAALMSDVDAAESKVDQARTRSRDPNDPTLMQAAAKLERLKGDLRDLTASKQEELAAQGAGEDPELHRLNAELGVLKARQTGYEQVLAEVEVIGPTGEVTAAKSALAREDVDRLRELQSQVERRIEQLEFDARHGARINQIDPARPGTLVRDSRVKLWAMSPIVILPLVLGLFLIVDAMPGRAGRSAQMPPKKTVAEDEEP